MITLIRLFRGGSLAGPIVTLCICSILCASFFVALRKNNQLAAHGAYVTGYIYEGKYMTNSGRPSSYELSYTYTINQKTYNGRDTVTATRPDEFRIGDTVQVTYDRTDPSIASIQESDDSSFNLWATIISGVIGAAMIGYILFIFSRRNWSLRPGPAIRY